MVSIFEKGFKVGNVACCGSGRYRGILNCGAEKYELCDNPSDYVFFDSVHPSEKAYQIFAQQMWNVSRPYSLKSLFQL